MKRLIGISLALAFAITAVAAIPSSAASPNSRKALGDTEGPVLLTFQSASDVFTFEVKVPKARKGAYRNGRLTVSTQDGFCCEDFWAVTILKRNGRVMDTAVGDASGTGNVEPDPDDWSGAASIPALPRKKVTVEVSYDHGSDTFPADMWVRFDFTGKDIVVTPTSS